MKDLLDVGMPLDSTNMSYDCLDNLPLAYAYVPYQKFENPYDMEKSLKYGTVFPGLNKPIEIYGKEFNKKAGAMKL